MLDNEVVQFAATLPALYKIKRGKSKYILRKYLSKYLPQEIWNRLKQGFEVPVSSWFKEKRYFDFAREALLGRQCADRGLFNSNGVERLLFDHRNVNRDYGDAIWTLLNFELWCQKFIDAPKIHTLT